jgi:hypothetical protein
MVEPAAERPRAPRRRMAPEPQPRPAAPARPAAAPKAPEGPIIAFGEHTPRFLLRPVPVAAPKVKAAAEVE